MANIRSTIEVVREKYLLRIVFSPQIPYLHTPVGSNQKSMCHDHKQSKDLLVFAQNFVKKKCNFVLIAPKMILTWGPLHVNLIKRL